MISEPTNIGSLCLYQLYHNSMSGAIAPAVIPHKSICLLLCNLQILIRNIENCPQYQLEFILIYEGQCKLKHSYVTFHKTRSPQLVIMEILFHTMEKCPQYQLEFIPIYEGECKSKHSYVTFHKTRSPQLVITEI